MPSMHTVVILMGVMWSIAPWRAMRQAWRGDVTCSLPPYESMPRGCWDPKNVPSIKKSSLHYSQSARLAQALVGVFPVYRESIWCSLPTHVTLRDDVEDRKCQFVNCHVCFTDIKTIIVNSETCLVCTQPKKSVKTAIWLRHAQIFPQRYWKFCNTAKTHFLAKT